MNRQELVEREVELVNTLSKSYLQTVQTVLSDIRKDKVVLWLSPADRYRLLTLKAWETKYRISTRTILLILLPFWESFVQRRSKKMKSRGLNVRVSTLTGKKSELILKDQLNKLYPSQENITLWSSLERERINKVFLTSLNKKEKKNSDGVRSRSDSSNLYTDSGKPKTLLDFSTPEAYVKYYRRLMQREQKACDELDTIMKRYAYRGNPFRSEKA